MDEDSRNALTQTRVDSKVHPTEVLEFTGMAADSNALTWQITANKSYQVAARRQLACQGVVCHADDSSTHGKPAEHILLGVAWDARKDLAVVPIPTV